MMGNGETTRILLKVDEITALACEYGTIQSIYISQEIVDAFMNIEQGENDLRYKQMKLLSVLFEAGRVQGIREERARRRFSKSRQQENE